VKTTRLGAVQRQVLMRVLNLAWDRAAEDGTSPELAWAPWQPKRQGLMENVTTGEASVLSRALVSLEERRLLMVRRHPGGRAYAVRLTRPGFDVAMELQAGGGRTIEQQREALAALLPAGIRVAVPIAYRELKRSDLDDEHREALARFVNLYDVWTGDPEDRGTGNYWPGINATPQTFVKLLRSFERLTELVDSLAHLRT